MNTVVSLRNYLLLATAVLIFAAIPISERLQFDQRIEAFFAPDNSDLKLLERSRADFGGDEYVIVSWTEERLFAIDEDVPYPASLNDVLEFDFKPAVSESSRIRIEELADRLNAVPGVNTAQTQHLPGLLHAFPPYRAARRYIVRMLEGALVGADGRTTGIILELLPEFQVAPVPAIERVDGMAETDANGDTTTLVEVEAPAKVGVSRGETLRQIRAIAAEAAAEIGEVAVAGEPVQVYDMFEIVEEDGQILFLVSLAILSLVLLLMFRTLRWVLAPVGLVLSAVVATRATLVLVGAELSMVSSMMNSLVTVIGIATFMHVIVHYRELREKAAADIGANSEDGESAVDQSIIIAVARQTLSDMVRPVFWTCVTTAVGFGSLYVSQITPVRSFATMMCVATGMVFLGCCVIMPATLGSGSRLQPPADVPLEHWLDRALRLTCHAVETRPLITGLICLTLFLGSIPGVFRLTIETDFSKNFKEESTIVQSLKFVEDRLGGAGSWEISFDTPEETREGYLLNDDFLMEIRGLTNALRELTAGDDSIRVLSLTDMSEVPPTRLFGTPTKSLGKVRRKLPTLVDNFYNKEARRMRIVLRSTEQQPSEEKAAQIVAIRKCVRDYFEEQRSEHLRLETLAAATPDGENTEVDAPPHFLQKTTPEASGMFVLLAELILSLLSDQLLSFLVACAGILVCTSIAFRSLRIGLISLFPNVFPVALVMGTLGWIGSPVNIGTAMITSVSMGLTVDSTIHYITAFERARKTSSVTKALQIAHSGAGRAVVFAHLALVAGFMVLTASRFVPLVYFGALLSLSMIGGIFGDLVLLPLMLRWTTSERAADTDETPGSES